MNTSGDVKCILTNNKEILSTERKAQEIVKQKSLAVYAENSFTKIALRTYRNNYREQEQEAKIKTQNIRGEYCSKIFLILTAL